MSLLRRVAALVGITSVVALLCACGTSASVKPSAARPATALTGARCAANRAAGTIKFISPFEYDASAGILDVYAAQQLGYFKQLCLNVTFDPHISFASVYPLVSSGAATITGEGSAADDLLEVASGMDLTAISTFGDASDYALLTRSSITKLSQLEGKTLGYHTQLPVVLTEMMQKAGVDVAKVHEVNDTGYDPTVLIKGHYDALQAYQSNEPLTLDAEGYSKDFREWTPAELGVKGTFNVQVVNSNFLKAHRASVSDFLRAELHAFDYCATHGATCVGFLAQAAPKPYSPTQALKEWQIETALAKDHTLPGMGVGVQSIAEWTPELQAVVSHKLVQHAPSLSSAMDPSLAASLYRGKQLIWP